MLHERVRGLRWESRALGPCLFIFGCERVGGSVRARGEGSWERRGAAAEWGKPRGGALTATGQELTTASLLFISMALLQDRKAG